MAAMGSTLRFGIVTAIFLLHLHGNSPFDNCWVWLSLSIHHASLEGTANTVERLQSTPRGGQIEAEDDHTLSEDKKKEEQLVREAR